MFTMLLLFADFVVFVSRIQVPVNYWNILTTKTRLWLVVRWVSRHVDVCRCTWGTKNRKSTHTRWGDNFTLPPTYTLYRDVKTVIGKSVNRFPTGNQFSERKTGCRIYCTLRRHDPGNADRGVWPVSRHILAQAVAASECNLFAGWSEHASHTNLE